MKTLLRLLPRCFSEVKPTIWVFKYIPVRTPGTRFEARNCISESGLQELYGDMVFEIPFAAVDETNTHQMAPKLHTPEMTPNDSMEPEL
jgi:hypothetical protein